MTSADNVKVTWWVPILLLCTFIPIYLVGVWVGYRWGRGGSEPTSFPTTAQQIYPAGYWLVNMSTGELLVIQDCPYALAAGITAFIGESPKHILWTKFPGNVEFGVMFGNYAQFNTVGYIAPKSCGSAYQ